MIKNIFNFKKILESNKELLQLAYGILLIVLIVASISFNSYLIIREYQKGFNQSLYHQAFILGKSVYSLVRDDLGDDEKLSEKLMSLYERSTEIRNISIIKPEKEGGFRVIASTDNSSVGRKTDFYLYKFAWQEDDNEGVTTDSFSLSLAGNEEDRKMAKEMSNSGSWFVALPMYDSEGEKAAVISIVISSEMERDITKMNNIRALGMTVVTIVIVILFLSLTLRLWDYVLLYKKTKDLDRMKDEFISMASHELRTPVTGIRGYVSMILDGSIKEDEKVKESLQLVMGSADRLSVLVEDLLNVSRIEQGRMKIDSSPTDIHPVIEEITKELNVQAMKKGIKFEYKPLSESYKINIDAERFKQVLVNLIGNAVKYTENGSVSVEPVRAGKFLEIRVKDTGIGMSSEEREKLFEKFYRIQNENTEKITGTGLGLWITKKLVELQGGRISVDSIKGTGSQFTVSFPIVDK